MSLLGVLRGFPSAVWLSFSSRLRPYLDSDRVKVRSYGKNGICDVIKTLQRVEYCYGGMLLELELERWSPEGGWSTLVPEPVSARMLRWPARGPAARRILVASV